MTERIYRYWLGGWHFEVNQPRGLIPSSRYTYLQTTHLTSSLVLCILQADKIEVEDVSGGCGAMFEVYVKDAEFRGLNTVKQHRIITATLQEEIKNMHGIRIHTEK